MKLDIGSNDGICEDSDIGLDIIAEVAGMNEYEGRVDIIADAHHLPFRDSVFSEVFSSRCIGDYTGEAAVEESIRVLRYDGEAMYNVHTYGAGSIIRGLHETAAITFLEANGDPDEGIYQIIIKAKKRTNPELYRRRDCTARKYLNDHQLCIADWELDNPGKKYSERYDN